MLSSGWAGGCSADTDGLSLGLDHDHDAILPSGVGRTGVLRGRLVDDLPRRVALEPFDDPPTDDNWRERAAGSCRRGGRIRAALVSEASTRARRTSAEGRAAVAIAVFGHDGHWEQAMVDRVRRALEERILRLARTTRPDGRSTSTTQVGFSRRNAGHAERPLWASLEARGVRPDQVTRIYSELQPCDIPVFYCDQWIRRTFHDNTQVTWSLPYPGGRQGHDEADAQTRANSANTLFTIVKQFKKDTKKK
jgi:hypothetical protein